MAPSRIVQTLGDLVTSLPGDLSFRIGQLLWVIRSKPSDRGPDWSFCCYKYAAKTSEHAPDRENRQVLLEGKVPKHYVTTNPDVMYRAKVMTPLTGTASDDVLTTAQGMLVDVIGELVDDSDWVIARIPDTDDFGLLYKPYIQTIQLSATILFDTNPSIEHGQHPDLVARRGDECVLLDPNPNSFWPNARVTWSLNPTRIGTDGAVPRTYLRVHQASTSDPEQLPRMRIPLTERRVVLYIPTRGAKRPRQGRDECSKPCLHVMNLRTDRRLIGF
ncbi:hypothetical protein BCR44DRAFT_34785 [Catenaria anguillulae PL171]|uniref:SH3 domain-containing protein n=1 Tax=Catenaria anguillulae PL171 TaxID=765915 RepID=A0A1Y2I4H0_9FUNG|nr:hypothetical protein BCR44DRAFT_34785 [Catenaria anguillulae PL171]